MDRKSARFLPPRFQNRNAERLVEKRVFDQCNRSAFPEIGRKKCSKKWSESGPKSGAKSAQKRVEIVVKNGPENDAVLDAPILES